MLSGGFSVGDCMRPGAIAGVAPIMEAVRKHADSGGYVLGICNGFQILCEAGLLPGVLTRYINQKFISKLINVRTETIRKRLTGQLNEWQFILLHVANGNVRYYFDVK